MKKKHKLFFSSFTTVFASVATTFITAYGFFKFAGPVPISVKQTTVEKKDTFDVAGQGKVIAVPNVAQISLGVKEESQSVEDAQSRANNTINTLEKELEKFGVNKRDIQTSNYQLYPRYKYENDTRKLAGYVVSTDLKVKIRDFDKVNQAVDMASAIGINQIGQLTFLVDDESLEELKNEARKKAIKDAKQKAKFLASNVGVKLGKIINLSEDTTSPTAAKALGGPVRIEADEAQTQIQPGSAEIVVNITLSYEIE